MKKIILFVLSVCLQSSPTIVDPKEKQKKIESSEEFNSKSIEAITDTQSLEERQVLHGPIHSHKPVHYYRGDNLAYYGSCRRKFGTEVLIPYASKSKAAVCSPLSALMPLAKLALGAEGRGKEELLNAIGLRKRSKIKDKYKKLIKELKRLAGVEITLASQIFIHKKYRVRSSFRKSAEKIFGSSIETVDFKNKKAAEKTLNSWVSRHTKCNFNYELDGSEKCVILNAITFRARWATPFIDSGPKTFHSPKGDVFLKTMHRKAMYNYFESKVLDAQILEVPYERNEASFVVVLPKSKNGLPGLLSKLRMSTDALTLAIMQMEMKFIKVSLPKFSLSTQINLKSVFQSLPCFNLPVTMEAEKFPKRQIGLSRVFSPKSGLKKIVRDEEVAISWAYQATKIIVNEAGTIAVSSTDEQIRVILGAALEKNTFIANRPFLFLIKALGEQIFTGIYTGKDDAPREWRDARQKCLQITPHALSRILLICGLLILPRVYVILKCQLLVTFNNNYTNQFT